MVGYPGDLTRCARLSFFFAGGVAQLSCSLTGVARLVAGWNKLILPFVANRRTPDIAG